MKSPKFTKFFDDPKAPLLHVGDLPLDQQTPFLVWLDKLPFAFPIVNDSMVANACDYELWYDYWIKDEEAPIN